MKEYERDILRHIEEYPTMQATARPFPAPSNDVAAAILEANIALMADKHLEFETLDATSHAIVAGCRANVIRATFLLPAQPDEEILLIPVMTRAYTIFSTGIAFTVGLASSTDPAFFDEADFEAIVRSVRIGA